MKSADAWLQSNQTQIRWAAPCVTFACSHCAHAAKKMRGDSLLHRTLGLEWENGVSACCPESEVYAHRT